MRGRCGGLLAAALQVPSVLGSWCEPFSNPTDDIGLTSWKPVSVSSKDGWFIEERPDDSGVKGALANGFGSDEPSDDWLVSPRLVASPGARLDVMVFHKYHGSPALELRVSNNYRGDGSPLRATWDVTQIQESLAEVSNDQWHQMSFSLQRHVGKPFVLAFRYRSEGVIGGTAALQGVRNACLASVTLATPDVCEEFTNPTDDITLSQWKPQSVASAAGWTIEEAPGDSGVKGAIMNGWGADGPSDDWLVSPPLAVAANAQLFFDVYHKYSGSPALEVMVSRDYVGGTPAGSAWDTFRVEESVSENGTDAWVPVLVDLGQYASSTVTIAFRYQSPGVENGQASRQGVDNICVAGAAVVHQRACEPFDNPTDSIEATPWAKISVAGSSVWGIEERAGRKGAVMNGFGADVASDDWLVSPWLELWDGAAVTFDVYHKHSGSPALELKVSRDYSTTGNVSTATWETTAIAESLADVSDDAWARVVVPLTQYAGGRVHVAFRYQSVGVDGGAASRQGVDNVCFQSALALRLSAPFCEEFENAKDDITLTQYSRFNAGGNTQWVIEERSGRKAAIGNGFGADAISDDWLISPRLQLLNSAVVRMLVYHAYSGSPALQLKVSADYGGVGDPSAATWLTINVTESLAEASDNAWVPALYSLEQLAGSDVHVAFRYQSTGTGGGEAARQGIDSVCVTEAVRPVCELFNDHLNDIRQSTYTQYVVSSSARWGIEEHGGRTAAFANGFGADTAADKWLISSPFVPVSPNARVTFGVYHRYSGSPALELLVSSNYPGTGDPRAAQWDTFPIQESLSDATEDSWVRVSMPLAAYRDRQVRMAFRYQSTGTAGGQASRQGVSAVCLFGTASVERGVVEEVIPPAPEAPPLCDGCVRLLLQYRTEMQAVDKYGVACPDLAKADCTGGLVVTKAWMRHWHVPNRTVVAYGVDARSRLVLFHPMGMELNLLAQEQLGAQFAVLNEPHLLTQDGKRTEVALQFIQKAGNAAPVVTTNIAFENLKFQVYAGLLRREHVFQAGERRIGLITLFGSKTFIPVVDPAIVVPASERRLREVFGCDSVVVVCTRYAFPYLEETEKLARFGVDAVIPFQCSSGEDECGDVPAPYKLNGTWFLPRPADMSVVLRIDIPPPGPGGNASIGWAPTLTPDGQPPRAFQVTPEWAADQAYMQNLVNEALAADPVVSYSSAVMPSGELGAGRGGLNEGPRIDPCRREECQPGNLASSAILQALPVAELVILNGGLAQDGGWGVGNVSAGDVYQLYPHANTLCQFLTYAWEIYRALEENVARVLPDGSYDHGAPNRGGFPQVAGMRYTFDPTLPPGSRVLSVEVRNRTTGEWAPLDRRRVYTVGTLSYLCSGGDGYTFHKLDGTWRSFADASIQSVIIHHLEVTNPYTPALEGRITVVYGSAPGSHLGLNALDAGDCTDKQKYVAEWRLCEDCPPGTYSPAGESGCIPKASSSVPLFVWLIIGCVLVLIGLPVTWKLTANQRRIRSLYNNNRVAEETARAVADMRLEDVNWLFDLDQPNRIQSAFIDIILAIREFRTYLPAEIIDEAKRRSTPRLLAIEPPHGRVTLVFTDVKSSTKLWERDPHSMDLALEQHNTIIRETLNRWAGYEVKTIGDAFMSAFAKATDACACFLAVQEQLLYSSWPDDDNLLGEMTDYMRVEDKDGALVHHGLRLRIGVHTGACRTETNPLTERYDYKGPPVNIAARVEGTAEPGMVAITADVLAEISSHLSELGNGVTINPFGQHRLKGVGELVTIYYLLSDSLRQRQPYFHDPKLLQQVHQEAAEPSTKIREVKFLHDPGDARRSRVSHRKQHNPLSVLPSRTGSGLSSRSDTTEADADYSRGPNEGRFRRQVHMVAGSCAVVALPSNSDIGEFDASTTLEMSNMTIEVCATTAGITKGRMSTVTGEFASVLWNVTSDCIGYRAHCIAFLMSFPMFFYRQTKQRSGSIPIARVGGSSGHMRHGRVGTGRQRFTATVGLPMHLAQACAEACRFFQVPTLFASIAGTPAEHQKFTRLLDVWDLPSGEHAHVEEVFPSGSQADDLSVWDLLSLDDSTQKRKSDARDGDPESGWRKAVFKALQGDSSAISAMQSDGTEQWPDRTAALVAELLVEHARRNPQGKTFRVTAPIFGHSVRLHLRLCDDQQSPRLGNEERSFAPEPSGTQVESSMVAEDAE